MFKLNLLSLNQVLLLAVVPYCSKKQNHQLLICLVCRLINHLPETSSYARYKWHTFFLWIMQKALPGHKHLLEAVLAPTHNHRVKPDLRKVCANLLRHFLFFFCPKVQKAALVLAPESEQRQSCVDLSVSKATVKVEDGSKQTSYILNKGCASASSVAVFSFFFPSCVSALT